MTAIWWQDRGNLNSKLWAPVLHLNSYLRNSNDSIA